MKDVSVQAIKYLKASSRPDTHIHRNMDSRNDPCRVCPRHNPGKHSSRQIIRYPRHSSLPSVLTFLVALLVSARVTTLREIAYCWK